MIEPPGERSKKPFPNHAFRGRRLNLNMPLTKNSDRTLQESPLMKKIFIDDGGRFGRKLSPFLQQAFDVFPDEI